MQAATIADPRPFRSLLAVAVVTLLLLLGGAGLKSYRDLEAARRHEQALQAEIAATRTHIQTLDRQVRRLEKDPATLERLAREELWMAKPEDVVIVLPGAPR